MAVTEVATRWTYKCDGCGTTEDRESKSRPKHWSDLHILCDAYDFQGAAVADGSVKLLLCLGCGEAAVKAINKSIDDRRAALGETKP